MADAFMDLYKLNENDRIDYIGDFILAEPANSAAKPLVFALVVEDDVKADRYIKKLNKKFPTIRVTYRGPCEVPGCIAIKLMGPPR